MQITLSARSKQKKPRHERSKPYGPTEFGPVLFTVVGSLEKEGE